MLREELQKQAKVGRKMMGGNWDPVTKAFPDPCPLRIETVADTFSALSIYSFSKLHFYSGWWSLVGMKKFSTFELFYCKK